MCDDHKSSKWNSLAVAKLITSVLTPIAVVIAGLLVKESLAVQDRVWQYHDRLLQRRLFVYDQIVTNLDRISCYIQDVGDWKEETPDSIIRRKRQVDATMFVNRGIWPPDTFTAYTNYMNTAFNMHQGIGKDAEIRASTTQKSTLTNWMTDWSNRFSPADTNQEQKYDELMNFFSRDLALDATR